MTPPGVRESDAFRLLEEEVKHQGKVVSVHLERILLPNGCEARHERLELPAAVAIVPLLEAGARTEVVLVEQFRSSLRGYIHEIPAGILEPGEEPAACARRELEEETGFTAGRLTALATLFPIPGTSAHRMHFFLAEDLAPGSQRLEEAECLSVKRFPLANLVASILEHGKAERGKAERGKAERGKAEHGGARIIVDAKTHLGVLHAALLRAAEGR
jgi:ADP-ribose pyrophosphatase